MFTKKKISLILIFIVCGFFSPFVFWQSISLSSQSGDVFWNWCIVPVDIYVDAQWEEISAIDLVMEASLIYKDFVPTEVFPYYLPPVVKSNGLVHIVWFTVDPSERFSWSNKIWTLYFEQTPWSYDGTVKFLFLSSGDTTDTNLSKAGWIDVLNHVKNITVSFSSNLTSCQHESPSIEGGFAGMTYDESLDATLQKIYDKYGSFSLAYFLKNNIYFVLFGLVLVVIFILYRKGFLSYFYKNFLWKKYSS